MAAGILLRPEHDSNGKSDLRVQDVLAAHGFGETPRDQRIVLGPAKERCDPNERLDELGKVTRSVTGGGGFFDREGDAVPRRQLHNGWRFNRALQVNMQLGLWQGLSAALHSNEDLFMMSAPIAEEVEGGLR